MHWLMNHVVLRKLSLVVVMVAGRLSPQVIVAAVEEMVFDGVQNMRSQNMVLWNIEYFKLKKFKKTEETSAL